MNVLTCDPELARATRLRLWAEHLEASGRGRRRARRTTSSTGCGARSPSSSAERLDEGRPATHRLIELRGVSRRSGALLGPLQSLVVDG